MSETALRTPCSVKKEGRRCSRHWSRDHRAVHGAVHGEAAVPLQHMEVNGGADFHPQPMEDPTLEERYAQRRM